MRLLTVVAGVVRVCGWGAVIAAALAVLAAGMACSLASAPRVRPAGTTGAAPAAGPHSAGARTGGGGQGQSAGAEIDPAYFSPGACVAFQVLGVRRERMDEVHDVIAAATAQELERNCVPPASPGHPRKDHTVLQCPHVVLKEEWQHHRYAIRDLAVIEKRPG
jgi:hypothetical protein